jgi:hypothetical protein
VLRHRSPTLGGPALQPSEAAPPPPVIDAPASAKSRLASPTESPRGDLPQVKTRMEEGIMCVRNLGQLEMQFATAQGTRRTCILVRTNRGASLGRRSVQQDDWLGSYAAYSSCVSTLPACFFFKKRRKELLILIPEWALGRCPLQIRSKEPSLHTEPRECRTRGKIAWVSHLGVRTKPCCGEGRGCRRGNFGSARNGSIRNLSPSFRAPG